MFSSEAILAILAFGDMEDALGNTILKATRKTDVILHIFHASLLQRSNIFKNLRGRHDKLN